MGIGLAMALDMRRWVVSLVLVVALVGPASAGRPAWLGGRAKIVQPNPRYVAPPPRQPGQRQPGLEFHQVHNLAVDVYRDSTALKSIGALYARRATLSARSARREVQAIGRDIEAKYGLRVVLVPDRVQIKGLDAADGFNPGKWDDAKGVIYLRASMTPDRLVRELAHEYGVFLLARRVGGRGNVPRVGQEGIHATHMLDSIVKGESPAAKMGPLRP